MMHKEIARRRSRLARYAYICLTVFMLSVAAPAVYAAALPLGICGLLSGPGAAINGSKPSTVGLNDQLWVVVAPLDQSGKSQCATPAPSGASSTPINASQYVLFLNGTEVKKLDNAIYDAGQHALVFRLTRNDDNSAFWAQLLGGPTAMSVPVTVALGERAVALGQVAQPTMSGDAGQAQFRLEIFSPWRLILGGLAVIAVFLFVWGHAKKRTTLRDNLIPQLEASRQTYSLGRWQMAFWFTLIFASFIFLLVVLFDYNTVSAQALILMGISGTTAFAAVEIDAIKNSPADDVNRGLRALGLKSHDDVIRVQKEIADRQKELAGLPQPDPEHGKHGHKHHHAPTRAERLRAEILDRQMILRTFEEKTRPFVSEGWFKDLTTDLNGSALHRMQSFCWTWVLGVVFVYGVYHELAMPQFSSTLLALMGVSCAGYVGFKYPEVNN